MGPKKGREPDDNYWRLNIEEAKLDDNDFKVKVILIEAAGSDQDRLYLHKFETYAAEERRFVIKNICKTETIFMVNQLGGEKKVKDDSLRVFEEGQAFLKEKKDIPADILALIIKHLIIKMKDEYLFIKRQRLEVREGMRRESATMIDKTEVRGTVSVKAPESPEPPPPSKGKGKKAEQEPENPEPAEGKKYNTLLRVRGEEWRDKVYVDDFPVDGPNLYVAVTGFVEPYLAGCLINIGIPLTAIVQVRIDTENVKVPSTLYRATKRGQSQTELLMEMSLKFWDDLQEMRIHKDTTDVYKATAFVIFSPPYHDAEALSGDPNKIYDEVCFLMYDLQDLTRQHIHYLDNMTIINIAEQLPDMRYIKCYHTHIDDLPLECVTTYSVLDSILQTVCISQKIEENNSKTSISTIAKSNQNIAKSAEDVHVEKAQNLVKDVFNTLMGIESNKKRYRVTYGEEYETHKDPKVINYGDFAKLPTFHLGNINLDNIIWSTLFGLPVNKLWQTQDQPHGEHEAKINFHVTMLLSCFERKDVETSELNRLLHILAFRKLYNNRSSLKKLHIPSISVVEFKKRYLKRSILAEPLPRCPSLTATVSSVSHRSCPSLTKVEHETETTDTEERRTNFLFDCPDISELISATEIANNQPVSHMIDSFDFFEDFNGICAFQTLFKAFNMYNCIDYKYCEVTDCFVFIFFNNHDKDGIARDEWRCHLSTPLCLQDFFDFVLEENYTWIQNEERMYDETINTISLSANKDVINPLASKSCVQNTDVETELLMEGSLKHKVLEELEEGTTDVSDIKLSPTKTATSPATTDADAKSSRKTKSPTTSTPKNARKSFISSTIDSNISVVVPAKPFSGYNLGDRRVEVLGKNAKYFSTDGTTVSSSYTLTIPMNLEYIALNVNPGNKQNEFWVHKVLGELDPINTVNASESFRVVSKNQVLFNIVKQVYQVPISIENPDMDPVKLMESNAKSPTSDKLSATMPPLFETKSYHSFYITWPNGLITESVNENDSQDISHIKQFYVNPPVGIDEDMRCISLNGEVVIFKRYGDIEVLRPDSTYIKITKYQKRPIIVIPVQMSETSSEKNKKGKVKEKPKEKSNKSSSKSSKQNISDDDKPIDAKPLEYEIVIDEFEIIESSGLKQQYTSGEFFDIERLLVRTATDYCLGEIFSRRMDHTHVLLNKDGIQIVTFPNNTRIITEYYLEVEEIYPEWTDEENEYFELFTSDVADTDENSVSRKSEINTNQHNNSNEFSEKVEEEQENVKNKERTDGYLSVQIIYTIEHAQFTTVSVDKGNGKITVDSPDGSKLAIETHKNNNYSIVLDSFTKASFDGENLNITYDACSQCVTTTSCDVTITTKFDENNLTGAEVSSNNVWLKLIDSHGVKVVVNNEGAMSIINEPSIISEETEAVPGSLVGDSNKLRASNLNATDAEGKHIGSKSETSVTSHNKCREIYLANSVRFFVLRRDLSCSELVPRVLVDDYKGTCRWKPWCAINQFNTFGDNRRLLSILTPLHLTETEKWVMDSKLADKPKHLAFKDLKPDTGKGFYHWMRPYDRFMPKPMKPDNALPERLPKAFVLRTLEEQWSTNRETLCGAKELLYAILRYRHIMESDSETLLNTNILEPRPQDERRIDDILQALAHRVYEELKQKLDEDVQRRAIVSITTKPLPVSEISFEGELEEESVDELWNLEQERSSLVKEVESVDNVSPNLKRYWRRRAEELKEEEFFKYLLREGNVPPYFRNVLGGAIWWDMNYTADTAVSRAERKKWKCVCEESSGQPSWKDTTLPSEPFM